LGKKEAQASEHFASTYERKSTLTRNSTYRKDTTEGFIIGEWESHHIACDHAITGREISGDPDTVQYVEDCLWITDWNLNNPDNLIGLPTNLQYVESIGKEPINYCSHQVDHNTNGGYTDECKQWLKNNVWDKLNDKREKHDVNAENIKKALEKCTTTFKRKLKRRGRREPGTIIGWEKRFEDGYKNFWYLPFSMAQIPNRRNPGINYGDLEKILKKIR